MVNKPYQSFNLYNIPKKHNGKRSHLKKCLLQQNSKHRAKFLLMVTNNTTIMSLTFAINVFSFSNL